MPIIFQEGQQTRLLLDACSCFSGFSLSRFRRSSSCKSCFLVVHSMIKRNLFKWSFHKHLVNVKAQQQTEIAMSLQATENFSPIVTPAANLNRREREWERKRLLLFFYPFIRHFIVIHSTLWPCAIRVSCCLHISNSLHAWQVHLPGLPVKKSTDKESSAFLLALTLMMCRDTIFSFCTRRQKRKRRVIIQAF